MLKAISGLAAVLVLVVGCGGGGAKIETPAKPAPMPTQGPGAIQQGAPPSAQPPAKDLQK